MDSTIQLKEIKCSNCGGEIQFEPSTQLVICNFCGSTFDLRQAQVVQAIAPDGIVPFKVTKKQFHSLILQWLIQGDYTPDDILSSSTLNRVAGIYLPFFMVEGNYSGSWSASSGYDRTETYTEYVRKTRYVDGRTIEYTEPETRYRTVTDWRPSSGGISGNFTKLGIASALLPDEMASFCEETGWSSGDLQGFDSRYIVGFGLEDFSAKSEEVIRTRIYPKVDSQIGAEVYGMVPGDHKQDIQWNAQRQVTQTSRIYLPFWLATYSYKNEKYQCAIDGQQADRIHGNKPVDKERVAKIKLLFLPFKLLSVAFVISLVYCFSGSDVAQYVEPVALWGALVVATSGCIGWLMKRNILSKSRQLRQRYLEQIRKSQGELPEESSSSMPQRRPQSTVKETKTKPIPRASKLLWLVIPAAFVLCCVVVVVVFDIGPSDKNLKINVDNPVELANGISQIRTELSEHPKDAMLWYNLGRLYLYKHDTVQAKAVFKKAVLFNLNDTTALEVAGCAILGEDNEVAAEAFRRLILQCPNHKMGYQMLGAAYTAMNKFKESLECYEKALELSPNDPLLYMGIGSNYYRLGEFDKAIQAMEKAIGLDPSFGEAKSLLGDFYLASCNLDDARRLFDDVIRNENNSMFARNMAQLGLADIFVAEKNPVSAHELLDKIPENDSIIVGSKYCALARMLEQQNNIDLARRYYLRAAFSTKQMVGAYADLGVMLVKNGENQEGYQYLQKVKDSDPMIDKMAYKKGLIWYSKGKTEPAIRMIERASLLGNIDAKKWLENNPQTNR